MRRKMEEAKAKAIRDAKRALEEENETGIEVDSRPTTAAADVAAAFSGSGGVDVEAWSSGRWPVGPRGFVHPPARSNPNGDLDTIGERALEAAWARRLPPADSVGTRFALGVESPPKVKLPPQMPDKRLQRFSDLMDHYALRTIHFKW